MANNKNSAVDMRFSGRQLGVMFILFLPIHMLIVKYASQLFSEQIVLGNHFFPPAFALLYSMIAVTFMIVVATPFIEWIIEHLKLKLQDPHWIAIYLVINFFAIWSIARWAEMIGMGIASWMVAAGLAVAFTLVQGGLIKYLISRIK